MERWDTWVPPYKALLCRGRCLHRPGGTDFQIVRRAAGGQGRPPLRKRILRCVGEGLCPSRGRGNRRSAAGGRRSEAVSRKCPDWRTRQWPSVGWHDGGQENPAPTEFYKKCLAAGDRKGRPYGGVTRGAVRWADVGSEPNAASGRGSEVSEWPRSKFPASAVRQRRNFGHRNRIIGPYEFLFSWGLHI